MEPPSARPWLGVGAALSALPAAGGCFCAALVLAVVADSDPGAVYEQHRWLGAVVAASAVCAFVAMMGWATLRHGGLPSPVLLVALVLAGVPFLLPSGLFIPAAAVVVAGSAGLATFGLAHPPASLERTRVLTGALAGAAAVLAVGQAIAVGLQGEPPRAKVLASHGKAERAPRAENAEPRVENAAKRVVKAKPRVENAAPRVVKAKPRVAAPKPPPAKRGGKDAAPAGAAPAEPTPAAPSPAEPLPGTPAPADAAPPEAVPGPGSAAAEEFVRSYYAALDGRNFKLAWKMLSPDVQAAFGGFAAWRKGYARTVSHAPGDLEVTDGPGGTVVGLTLRAGDRDACGNTVERRFAVTWRLVRTEAGWRAAAASARKLDGPEPC